ncbi:MAG: hypothetical protein QOC66_3427 [Pseudonocardiales bacterium]|nr:hypothetical protein [Pseudonocardiales bacterium]
MNGGAGRTITLLGRVGVAPTAQFPDAAVWRGRRAELVFAYLAAEHGRQVTNDELADALWPDGLPETWEAGLRGVLTEVRRYLTESGLAPAVVLALPAEVTSCSCPPPSPSISTRRGRHWPLPTRRPARATQVRPPTSQRGSGPSRGSPSCPITMARG